MQHTNGLEDARNYEAKYGGRIGPENRPVFHVSPYTGWANDPNGFSVYKGEYHLFYQYYPYETVWGPMHWGHVKSADLIKWEYLPCALAPDSDFDRAGCWSGGAVETQDGEQMLIYTGRMYRTGSEGQEEIVQVQCMATGDGTDYRKYEGNPVLDAGGLPEGMSPYDFRDPKIWRDEEEDCCYMLVSSRGPDGSGCLLLYRSGSGREWTFVTVLESCNREYGSMWECPDFFTEEGVTDKPDMPDMPYMPDMLPAAILVSPQEMELAGEFQNRHGNIVLTGRYDRRNHHFIRETVHAVDDGYDFYAAQTLLAPDGRRIMIAWMQGWENARVRQNDNLWFGMMTLPREVSIRRGRLFQQPVRELEKYRTCPVRKEGIMVSGSISLEGIRGRCLDMTVRVRQKEDGDCRSFSVCIAADQAHGSTLRYDFAEGLLTFDRSRSGYVDDAMAPRRIFLEDHPSCLELRFILDRYSAEIFVNGGEHVITSVIPTPLTAGDILFGAEGKAVLDIEKYEIRIS